MLHYAVLGGSESVVQLLLEAGAEPASQDGAGRTPLSLAVLVGQWGCSEALLRSPGGAGTAQVAEILTQILMLFSAVDHPWCFLYSSKFPLRYTPT